MDAHAPQRRSTVANVIYGVLDPIPYGCFVAALVFDIIYMRTAGVLWNKGAAWLIVFGLLAAVIPRFINLAQVWVTSRRLATGLPFTGFDLARGFTVFRAAPRTPAVRRFLRGCSAALSRSASGSRSPASRAARRRSFVGATGRAPANAAAP